MASLRLALIESGATAQLEGFVLAGAPWRRVRFPSTVGVIEHPTAGVVLFDTGYSERFFSETQRFPERLYRWVTPLTLPAGTDTVSQLRARGIEPEDVRWVIVSHFHADHIGGLRDFPRARFICSQQAYTAVRAMGRLQALRHAVLPGLLPDDFASRCSLLDSGGKTAALAELPGFETGWDIFQDGCLVAVPLPGHAPGQIGLVVRTTTAIFFLVADACWRFESIAARRPPHPITRLIHEDMPAYRQTIERLADLHAARPDITLVPCHCEAPISTVGASQAPAAG